MEHKYSTIIKWINISLDYFILNLTLYLSFLITNDNLLWREVIGYKLTIILLNFCWFFSSSMFDIYVHIHNKFANSLFNSYLGALCLFTLLATVIKIVLPDLYVPPTPFVYYFTIFPTLIIISKLTYVLIRKYKLRLLFKSSKAVIIGCNDSGFELCNYINRNLDLEYHIAGIFDDKNDNTPSKIKYLGTIDECIEYSIAHNVNEIFCTLPYSDYSRIKYIMDKADNNFIRFRLVPDIKGAMCKDFLVDMLGGLPVLKPRQEPLESKSNEIIKRSFDILFSLFVIVTILSWLAPIVGLLIKFESKGPVFFKQLRSGKNNKPFYCYKFRSMYINDQSDNLQACKGDSRITRIGKFLRKTSLDEFPQFINVLLGDMSVVGPRPHMLKHTTDYSQVVNNYMVRHFLTPGITGWAQVNGFRGETKETKAILNRVKADLWYLENWSIFLDLKIVFLTIWTMISHDDNAY